MAELAVLQVVQSEPEAEVIVDAHLARWLGGREEFLKV